ncbi:hypothetical protein [Streptomyces sp. SPB074]|uniref:hypothetical protein n=1 Tax=Streptomyces sp. (strain SPB074) TaxID=465543 RepID=UPI001F1A759A|nr:hypothetical protein [Streptomyces sp. SPB074]
MPVETLCRVCGNETGDEEHPSWDRYGAPRYLICDCCGIESGLGDDAVAGTWEGTVNLHSRRGTWVTARGAAWEDPGGRPPGWDLVEWMPRVPAGYRTPPPPPAGPERLRAAWRACPGAGTETVCRVCGFADGGPRWHEGVPTGARCPCCGAEPGVDDVPLAGTWRDEVRVVARRGWWLANGARWAEPAARPGGWDVVRQLAAVPPRWHGAE